MTVAPGRTPPWASVTVPARFPVVTVWAATGAAQTSAKTNATARLQPALVRNFIRMSPRAGCLRDRGKGVESIAVRCTTGEKRPPGSSPSALAGRYRELVALTTG